MKRIFTRDVYKTDGSLRWPKGMVSSDYPPATWHTIANSLGMELDDFSIEADGMLDVEPGKVKKIAEVVRAKRMKQKFIPRRRPVTSPRFVA